MIERKFVGEAVKKLRVSDFVRKELEKAGIVDVSVQRTTLATRVSVTAERPGLIIGKKGKNIKDLAEAISKELSIENPQVDVSDVEQSSLEPTIIARWIARMLERGYKPKRVVYRAKDRVMGAGAMGVEIVIKGKIHGKGAKARKERVIGGYLKKSGESVKNVRVAQAKALLKQGIIGVTVKIVPPGVVFPDKIDVKKALGEKHGDIKVGGNKGDEQERASGEAGTAQAGTE